MGLINLLSKQFVKEIDGHVKVLDPDAFTTMVEEFLTDVQEQLLDERLTTNDKKLNLEVGPRTLFHIMRAMDRQMCVASDEEVDKYLNWAFNRMDLLNDEEINMWLKKTVKKFRAKFGEQVRQSEAYPDTAFKVRC